MESTKKKTVLLGASDNPSRYSYLAVDSLNRHNHPVVAIGRHPGAVGKTEITTQHPAMDDVDTVTLYMNAQNQRQYYDYILSLHPKRIIFNPGAENDELAALAASNGIQPVQACTLVLLSTGQY